ncbi:MAG: IS701 family transposase [Methylococcales bacterium]
MTQAAEMLNALAAQFAGIPVLVVADSWFGNNGLFRPLAESEFEFRLLSRLRSNTTLYDLPPDRSVKQLGRARKYGERLGNVADLAGQVRDHACSVSVFLYGKQRSVIAYDRIVLLKNLRSQVRIVWVFRHNRWVAFFSTDLDLSVEQIIEFYGARWKIESGFKEIKQEIGSARSQARNAHAVTNHLNFCLMAATVTGRFTPIASKPIRSVAACCQGTHQFRLLRCSKAHQQCRFERGFSKPLDHPTQTPPKFFRRYPPAHGGLTLGQADTNNFGETSGIYMDSPVLQELFRI